MSILNWVTCFPIVEFMISMYNLDSSPLLDTSFSSPFSKIVTCLLSLLVTFTKQIKKKWNISYFFMNYSFGAVSKSSLSNQRHSWFPSVFSSRWLMVLCFKYMIHPEVIFVKGLCPIFSPSSRIFSCWLYVTRSL